MTHLTAIQSHFLHTVRNQVRPYPYRTVWAIRRLTRQYRRGTVALNDYRITLH